MKNKVKFILGLLCFVIAFFGFNCLVTNSSYAWTTDELKISNMEINDGVLNSVDLCFDVPDDLAETTSWVGIQTKPFNEGNGMDDYGDLTDMGTVYNNNYTNLNSVLSDEEFCKNWGIEGFNKEGFLCFGDYSTIKTTISDINLKLSENKKIYVYLWTFYSESFYPDALIATFEINDGKIIVTNSDGNQVKEPETIERIEIQDANLALKVGEEPIFTAKLKNYEDEIDLTEAFISLNRESMLVANSKTSDKDGLVKDFNYFYDIELTTKKGSNYKFGEETKIFVNGVEKKIAYLSEERIVIANEDEVITPEGYVAPSVLNNDFEEKQRSEIEEIILQAIKDGKVKYREEGFEDIIKDALENEKEIIVDFSVTETIRKSRAKLFLDEEVINEIDKNVLNGQNIQGYCLIDILVFVNGSVGHISELPTPVLVTMPTPNGISQLQDGYERIWKVIRYHDGNVEALDATETENGISFMSDKFSEFAAVYEDVKIEKNEENGIETESEIIEETINPKTGDSTVIFFGLMIISITLEVIIFIYQKRRGLFNH